MNFSGYLELCKPRIGVMIALTAAVGYAAVAESLDPAALVVLVLAMLLGSAGSSVFNHFYDRDIDRRMKRTAGRPLAAGLISKPVHALWFSGLLLMAGLWLALGAFNWAVALHLFLGAFIYAIVYTVWLKRRTWLNIVIGGAAGSFAVLAGAAAFDPGVWLLPVLMATTLFLWTPSHFWALAILLKDDYAGVGVPMLPVLVGEARCSRWILGNTILLVISAGVPWVMGLLGPVYGAVSTGAALLFLWQNIQLVRAPGRSEARQVFLGSMQYLSLVFLAVVLDRHLPVLW
ncbi:MULTISPECIES: heme o synthase [unclassified Haematospirillum]|uniref:heme o synthase n=1 Tax=unclassified Haematospirillum TaxID=2622088 RepID=UPI001439E79B|nr:MULTISPECIES: heme o synthase [unclassified Haematospirillum]NKD55008.1 protoheme IX farnesyltransferase [Haematospirillum sp. H4890]NKD75029.1 protoheme IX farnesyltransferase [Haematospirillum sp. H4485]NKD88436.1 protoheme IX farnesyltransferase [Haematospirillum sp. 15-248]